jgi:hypothetical protein
MGPLKDECVTAILITNLFYALTPFKNASQSDDPYARTGVYFGARKTTISCIEMHGPVYLLSLPLLEIVQPPKSVARGR